jgi:hypothetical protein
LGAVFHFGIDPDGEVIRFRNRNSYVSAHDSLL